ncbi:nuclear transport factor 2 family protein [Leptolyngbya sp. FACHB-261]|uniref:nuclear transport factor 2 family protein n=1 Tax=Leptolyngbya sp. FACHB-261 TaxID=2692806 RepID=UPI0016870666|nr:nuclear transport factor 2 family protein [Leptolyngbya sp. FACHB-261]MBD2104976.1 nuclear transport factor 2 family protein [Leptolyngbya sp. FACHB-261]
MSPETIQALVTAYFANFQAMNPDAWIESFTEDALIYDPVGKPPNKVHETARKFFGLLSMFFEKLQISQDQVFIVENGAAVKWTMQGWAKNGKRGTAEGISVFEIHETGKIQQVSSYWDDAAMMAQVRD